MITLAQAWPGIEAILNSGVNLIPVHDRGERAKEPCFKWTKYQTEKMSLKELYTLMDHYDTTAVAMVCGSASGNLEVIDIDSKHKHGFDAILFKAIADFYPEIWAKLRVHKTPSGGHNIIYRIDTDTMPGSQNLASRNTTVEEKETSMQDGTKRKHPIKTKCFVETRAQGSLCMSPPSLNYTVVHDRPIPLLSQDERDSLIQLAKTFHEVPEPVKMPRESKTLTTAYDESPFDDYNRRIDPIDLMESQGWTKLRENNSFIWFEHQRSNGRQERKVSTSFNKQTRFFYNFSAGSGLESEKGYYPTNILAILQFSGDYKRTHKYLVENGYGKLTPQAEAGIIKRVSTTDGPVPENLSPEGRAVLIKKKEEHAINYPLGTFWELDKEDKVEFVKLEFRDFLVKKGIGRYRVTDKLFIYIQITDNIVKEIVRQDIKDITLNYIENGHSPDVYQAAANGMANMFSAEMLDIIPEMKLKFLKDDRQTMRVFFKNCIVYVTAAGIKTKEYTELNGYIWESQVIQREFFINSNVHGDFKEFMNNVSGQDKPRFDSNCTALGYMMHNFKDRSNTVAVIINDEVISDNPEGGTGKGLIINAIKKFKNVASIDGKSFKFDKNFLWQRVNIDTQIISLEDVNSRFDFENLFSVLTDGLEVEKKGQSSFYMQFEDSPKVVITTNYAINGTGSSHERRRFEMELAQHYDQDNTPLKEFGRMFFDGWDAQEWNAFDNFIIESCRLYLDKGLIKTAPIHLEEKRLMSGTSAEFMEFMNDRETLNGSYTKKELYDEFLREYESARKWVKVIKFNKWLKLYCDFHKLYFSDQKINNQRMIVISGDKRGINF